MMRDERIVPTAAPAAGFDADHPRPVAAWAFPMFVEWRDGMKQFPRASLAGMAGIPPDRAQKLLEGSLTPRPSEAAAVDAALGTNAARHMPRVASHSYLSKPFTGPPPDRAMPKKTPAMSSYRQARVDAWKPLVEASGLSLAAIAEATGIGQGRTMRVLRLGAVEDAWERERLADVLNGEPS